MADTPPADPAVALLHKRENQLRAARKAQREAAARIAELEGRPSADAVSAELATLKSANRARDYEAAFVTEAKASGMTEAAAKTAWRLAKDGIDQTADAPDPAKIKAAAAQVLTDHPVLKGTDAPADDKAPLTTGQGAGKGAAAGSGLAKKLVVTAAQAADVDWMREHQTALRDAANGGGIEYVD